MNDWMPDVAYLSEERVVILQLSSATWTFSFDLQSPL